MSEISFEREVLDRLIQIEEKLDGFSKAKEKTYENERQIISIENNVQDNEKRISALEDSNRWISRTAVAAIITAAVGILFALIRTGAGM